MPLPEVSIIMPVYNGGAYLRDAVLSVLQQLPLGATPLPRYELLVVDDHSDEPLALAVLAEIAGWENVCILHNAHGRGAARARNCGLNAARGDWIAFLDADDLWFPLALAQRWQVTLDHPQACWVAGRIRLLRPGAAGFASVAQLAPHCPDAAAAAQAVMAVRQMRRPVAALAAECLVIPTTTLIRRRLLRAKGGFEESLRRAEDYHLWLRCADDTDLWLLPAEVAHYRIHSASLTHGDTPRYLHEDRMLALLLARPGWSVHRALLLTRLDMVMQDHCYFYRGRRRYGSALRCALRWLRRRPLRAAAWKEVLASCLRRG